VVAAALLGGCGGDGGAETPLLPQDLANSLAAQSDAVAASLDGGNPCGAADQARALRERVIAAVNEGRVPAGLQEELGSAANDLAATTETACTEAQAPPVATDEDEDEDEKGKGKGKSKEKGKGRDKHDGQGDDDTLPTDTLPTDTLPTTVITETEPGNE
jgi:hypothetical protein